MEKDSLDQIRKWISGCKRCKLHSTRRNIVFGVGDEKARLMLIGEAPGYEEDRKGEPFVGKAGQLLTRMLEAINLSRKDVYITNVVKCRPPQNRNPTLQEISACNPYLINQIKAIKPRLILTLGNFATQTLLGKKEGITRLRGRFYNYQGIKLLPTFHPSALLRNPSLKRYAWEDLKLMRGELNSY
ncbi:MAG: uracil-DNA glycosylase [bacterium]|nr:uracil-DNA glycosylase [bacterium]